MATLQPAANWAAGDSLGYLEDVSKKAPLLIDPADAIGYKSLPKEKVYQVQHDWLTDTLGSNVTPTPPQYAAEPTYTTTSGRSRVSNVIQQFVKVWLVAEISEIIAGVGGVAGIRSETEHEIELLMSRLAKQIERVIFSAQAVALDDGTNGSKMGGFFAKVTTNVDTVGSIVTDVGATTFEDKLVQIFSAGGDSKLDLYCQPAFAKIIGRNFTGRLNASENVPRSEHKVDMIMNTFAGQMGNEVNIMPDRSIGEGAALVSTSQASIGELRPIRVFAKDASTQHKRGFANTYLTFIQGNEKAHGGWQTASTPTALGS